MKRVFVSSTFTDLKTHRSAFQDGIRQLGLVDISMENLGARDDRPKDECLRLVHEESDIFVGIYAHRYGYMPSKVGVSITEAEYDAATLADIPRFVYMIDNDHPWRPKNIDHGRNKSRLESFKNRLLARHICQRFTTEDQLTARVVADLGRHLAMRQVTKIGPGIDVPDTGIDSLRVAAAETPDEWTVLRNGLYAESRGVFITHVIEPSKKPDQEFEVYIYLLRHKSDDLSDIRFAEFFLGSYWDNRIFPAVQQNGFIGIATAAYGTFLCVCKVTFDDGKQVLLHRYIDFESRRQGG